MLSDSPTGGNGATEYQDRDPLASLGAAAPPAATPTAPPMQAPQRAEIGTLDLSIPRRGQVPGDPVGQTPIDDSATQSQTTGSDREGFIPRERFDEVNTERTTLQERLAALEAERAAWEQERTTLQSSGLDPSLAAYAEFLPMIQAQGSPEEIRARMEQMQAAEAQEAARAQNEQFLTGIRDLVEQGHMTEEGAAALTGGLKPILDQLAQLTPLAQQQQRIQAEQRAETEAQRILKVYPNADQASLRVMLSHGLPTTTVLSAAKESHTANTGRFAAAPQQSQQQQPAPAPPPAPPVIPVAGGAAEAVVGQPSAGLGIPDPETDPRGYGQAMHKLTGDPIWSQFANRH